MIKNSRLEKCDDCGKEMVIYFGIQWICRDCCEHKTLEFDWNGATGELEFNCIRCGAVDINKEDYDLIVHKKQEQR